MAKRPTIYHGLDRGDRVKSAVLVRQGGSDRWFRFRVWEDRIFITDRREEYQNLADFLDGVHENDAEELRVTYLSLFKVPAPKNADAFQLAEAIWCKRYAMAECRENDYQAKKKDPRTGKRARKRNLNDRTYKLNPHPPAQLPHMAPQAKVCLKLFCNYLSAANKTSATEEEVIQMMKDAQEDGRLKTKQDPFRIWQYYRPTLVKEGYLKHD